MHNTCSRMRSNGRIHWMPTPCRHYANCLLDQRVRYIPQEACICSWIVYRILCKDCNNSYNGQWKRTLAAWLKENQQEVFTGDSNLQLSALAEHSMNTGQVDRTNSTALDSCQTFCQRSYLKVWYMHKEWTTPKCISHIRLCWTVIDYTN